jgi:hypothetical protein
LPIDQWKKYLDANGPEPAAEASKAAVRRGDRRDLCTEDRPESDVRAEPKERRASRTIVLETRDAVPEPPRLPTAPAIPRVIPGICDTGQPKCGQPARFYAAGWRCGQHVPRSA